MEYYAEKVAETHKLRNQFAEQLSSFEGWKIIPGIAKFLLCQLPGNEQTSAEIVKQCRVHGLFLRDAGAMGRTLGTHALRIAVKDADTNQRIIEILSQVRTRPILPMENATQQIGEMFNLRTSVQCDNVIHHEP